MSTYLYEIINPDTNRKIVVGGPTYKALVKKGKIQDRVLLVIDGRKCLRPEDVSTTASEVSFVDKEAKLKALREFKAQKDERKAKKVEKEKSPSDDKINKLTQKLAAQKLKNKQLKEQIKPLPKKEDHYEYNKSSLEKT